MSQIRRIAPHGAEYTILVYTELGFTMGVVASIYDPRYADLRQRLRAERLRAGLTQVEAASRLRKNQQYINRCEAGDRRIDFIEVLDFAALYGCSLEAFVPRRTDRAQ